MKLYSYPLLISENIVYSQHDAAIGKDSLSTECFFQPQTRIGYSYSLPCYKFMIKRFTENKEEVCRKKKEALNYVRVDARKPKFNI
mmetsp:Transcript_9434/g.12323  ORF Transcript_9434/g.12323 Transcript_9434/m.12323 type:complete len:86 (-) Transcript_9434:173-430(-)